jgi:hypothetical protein
METYQPLVIKMIYGTGNNLAEIKYIEKYLIMQNTIVAGGHLDKL